MSAHHSEWNVSKFKSLSGRSCKFQSKYSIVSQWVSDRDGAVESPWACATRRLPCYVFYICLLATNKNPNANLSWVGRSTNVPLACTCHSRRREHGIATRTLGTIYRALPKMPKVATIYHNLSQVAKSCKTFSSAERTYELSCHQKYQW